MKALVTALALALAAAAAPASATELDASFGAALNVVRAQAGLGGISADPRLSAAAQAYAEDMARTGNVHHVGLDGSTHLSRARAAGCRAGYLAENIAWGQRTAQSTFEGWMASAGHRANMLGRPYGAFGLGQAQGMWVIMFADRC